MIRNIKKPVALIAALLLMAMSIVPAAAVIEAEEAFYNTWARTDMPVSDGTVNRTWMWGPEPNTEVLAEPYAEHPIGERPVQYFDKSRMEVNNPNIEYDGLWYVTNGLLVVELMTGMMQVGDADFEEHGGPADIHIAGDPDQPETPTYATYAGLTGTPAFADGAVIAATVDAEGNVGLNADLEEYEVTAGPMSPDTGHRTASVFWDFMTSSGMIWDWETNEYTTGLLFQNPYYATGLPVTEAYWANIFVDGTQKWVLTQAFERRVLTYTPDNDPGWQVEAGNVGQHYYQWRYEMTPPPPPPPPAEAEHFHVLIGALNNSGVSGSGMLTLEDGMLHVTLEATGLEPNQTHAHHLHGFENYQQSVCPTPDMAGDSGLIEFADGLDAYGPVALGLAPSSEVGEDGTVSYNQTFDLAELAEDGLELNIETLVSHTIILHGMTVDDEYVGGLPVACGMIVPDVGFVSTISDVELPDIESEGTGFATFHVPADHTQLAFNLVVNDLENVTMAHIHLKAEGSEFGPPVLWLFGPVEAPGSPAHGVINSGVVGDLDLIGPLADQPMTALIDAMLAGDAYVNIHTTDNPGGEIRGEMELAVDHFDNGHDH